MRLIYRVGCGSSCPSRLAISGVARELRSGSLALLPTETVYGIGVAVRAFAGDGDQAVELPGPGTGYRRIFELKHRDLAQTVPWLVSGPEALDEFARDVDPRARALARAFWPGALTIVAKAAPSVPSFMQAADGTVALRASASAVVRALVEVLGSPLAVTSANTHGMPAPTCFAEVEARVLDGVDVAVDAGATPCEEASTIVSFESGDLEILRAGALRVEEIEAALLFAQPEDKE